MRFLMDPQAYDAMRARKDHTADCYVRPGEYLHHMYVDGVKYEIARAVVECLKDAQAKGDVEAVHHLQLHKDQLDWLVAQQKGGLGGVKLLGDPPPRTAAISGSPKTRLSRPSPLPWRLPASTARWPTK